MNPEANSELYYSHMDLREASSGASLYLGAVDKAILSNINFGPRSYLDVGCGDGIRAQRLVDYLQPSSAVFIDSSPEMIEKASKLGVANCFCRSILNLDEANKYDVITCLWNVLGHLENKQIRREALNQIYTSLTPEGLFFIDFNNRYNIYHYGLRGVFCNFLKDLFKVPSAGWFPLNSTSSVYIHNFMEAKNLLKSCGFRVKKTYTINYKTGSFHRLPYLGQTLFVVSKK
tara:strand:+ start:295 stop:987 length:693 start_codon:yes stop_codon:yes gene_type:complete